MSKANQNLLTLLLLLLILFDFGFEMFKAVTVPHTSLKQVLYHPVIIPILYNQNPQNFQKLDPIPPICPPDFFRTKMISPKKKQTDFSRIR